MVKQRRDAAKAAKEAEAAAGKQRKAVAKAAEQLQKEEAKAAGKLQNKAKAAAAVAEESRASEQELAAAVEASEGASERGAGEYSSEPSRPREWSTPRPGATAEWVQVGGGLQLHSPYGTSPLQLQANTCSVGLQHYGALNLQVGDEVEYYSDAKGAWQAAEVVKAAGTAVTIQCGAAPPPSPSVPFASSCRMGCLPTRWPQSPRVVYPRMDAAGAVTGSG